MPTLISSPDDNYTNLREVWSDAARAAAAAGRKRGLKGGSSDQKRRSARNAFLKAGGKESFGKQEFRKTQRAIQRRGASRAESSKQAMSSNKMRIKMQNFLDRVKQTHGYSDAQLNRILNRRIHL